MENNINDQPDIEYAICFGRVIIYDRKIHRNALRYRLSLYIKNPPANSRRCNDPQNILAMKEYVMNFLRIDPYKQFFFIDETGFQLNMIFTVRSRAHMNSSHQSRSGYKVSKLLCCMHDVLSGHGKFQNQ
ncbi:hypothetical protein RF11_15275 [Thelohanellus kitauei]|uniref:Uncharacterized protein n=1 Tax=Thelohanellus kitauei TaxID=669202 RepID=A0A0C2NF85_THEKT|nr:hypothetical protein RF11_15275 [Thelohanellus kitauei]